MNECSGHDYHELTEHSWLSVRQNPHRLDWENQPSPFKFYPESLPRIRLEKACKAHTFIYHIGGITAKKRYPGVEYHLRTNPSAGALYPTELYFQARDVEGFDDGIYHFEVASSCAVKLSDIGESEGLEPFMGFDYAMKGLLFFISSPWYRSAWKYRERAYRYCLLDGGHLLGAVEAGAYLFGHAWRLCHSLDLEGLDAFFGFGDEEFFLSGAVCAVPDKNRKIKPHRTKPSRSDPLGVPMEPGNLILQTHQETKKLHRCRPMPRFSQPGFHTEAWEEAILKRRSIRQFQGRVIEKGQLEAVMNYVDLPVPSDCDETIDVYTVIHRVNGMTPGIYKNGEPIKSGDFREKTAFLCLEQRLGGDGAVTFFLTSGGCNYRPLYLKAGLIGHRIYLAATYLGLGCSGIGAYYDRQVQTFLQTDQMILYALAMGL